MFDTPARHNRQSVANVIWNDSQLAEEDRSYIRHIDDLVTFCADKESTWVHEIAQFFFKWTSRRFARVTWP
jgi:hypothetical protein